MRYIALSFVCAALLFCSCRKNKSELAPSADLTAEKAYEGVSNYCHSAYDWSVAEDNPSIMNLEMGEETDSTYLVVFRSYTGALVRFYVDKSNGATRIVDYVPALNIEDEAGTIDLHEYLAK